MCTQGQVTLQPDDNIKYLNVMFNYTNFSHSIYLHEPRVFSQYGERSFMKAGPKLWNNLPIEVKSCSSISIFKSALKTHLFRTAFNIED